MIGWAQKLEQKFLGLTADGIGRRIVFESLLKNAFDSTHVQQFETQCTGAGMIDALGIVAFC